MHFYSTSYGGDHQADEQGGTTLSGFWGSKRDSDFALLLVTSKACPSNLSVPWATKLLLGKLTQHKWFLHELVEKTCLSHHFLDDCNVI